MIYPDKVYIPVVRGCSYRGKVYTAAEIGSIREVNTK